VTFGEEAGSGTLLAAGVVGGVVAALGLVIPLYTGLCIRESVGNSADASALAAADVAGGISAGVPCEVAAQVAAANRSSLDACSVDGLVVTVRASAGFLGLRLTATATAGPPVVGTN
jgi:secretion/DNA translocation related TadE-like protein